MTLNIDHRLVVQNYLEACCMTQNYEQFSSLLSEKVTLKHLDEKSRVSFAAEGRNKVLEVYKRRLFDQAPKIHVHTFSIREIDGNGNTFALVYKVSSTWSGQYNYLSTERSIINLENGKIYSIETESFQQ